jgi:hypothetical protein
MRLATNDPLTFALGELAGNARSYKLENDVSQRILDTEHRSHAATRSWLSALKTCTLSWLG